MISSSNHVKLCKGSELIKKSEMGDEDLISFTSDDDIMILPLPPKPSPLLIVIDDDENNLPVTECNENIRSLPATEYNETSPSLSETEYNGNIPSVIVIENYEDIPSLAMTRTPNRDREAKDTTNENIESVHNYFYYSAEDNIQTDDRSTSENSNFSSSKEDYYLPEVTGVSQDISQQISARVEELRQPSSIILTANKASSQQAINSCNNSSLPFPSAVSNRNHKTFIEQNTRAVSDLNQSSISIANSEKKLKQSSLSSQCNTHSSSNVVRSSSHAINSSENTNISLLPSPSIHFATIRCTAVCENQFAVSLSNFYQNTNVCTSSTQKNAASSILSSQYYDLQNSNMLNIGEDPKELHNERLSTISLPDNQIPIKIPESVQPVNKLITANIQLQSSTLITNPQQHFDGTLEVRRGN